MGWGVTDLSTNKEENLLVKTLYSSWKGQEKLGRKGYETEMKYFLPYWWASDVTAFCVIAAFQM